MDYDPDKDEVILVVPDDRSATGFTALYKHVEAYYAWDCSAERLPRTLQRSKGQAAKRRQTGSKPLEFDDDAEAARWVVDQLKFELPALRRGNG